MLLLTILFTSHYFLTISAQDGYLGKPRLHVIPEGEARLGSKVTIECISIYTIDGCKFYKNSEALQHPSSSFTETQYTFKSATALDEGLYTCQCSAYRIFSMKHWGRYTSPPADLVLNRNLEKPQILVRCMEGSNTCSKMKIECRISHYTLKECWFHRHGERQALYSNSSIDSGIQYVIQSVTMADEGPYTCECNSVQDKSTQTSDSVSLFIKRKYTQLQLHILLKLFLNAHTSFMPTTQMAITLGI
ncbi:uncharacterized protein LOC122815395 [Protopterus annectens]|uniref:uncharacterized protein LOC122815395 n=1 Tax=Protopterus annectens TaxID=7888 RepID=UPI001CFA7F37|nr:uncharacterized protein LOC122815395 [Protopterus annectens]